LKAFSKKKLGGYTEINGEGSSEKEKDSERVSLLRTIARETEQSKMYVEMICLYIWVDLKQREVWVEKTPTTLLKFRDITDSAPADPDLAVDILSPADELSLNQDTRTLTLRNIDKCRRVTELARLLGISKQDAFKHLTSLRDDGYIKRERTLEGVVYTSTPRGQFFLNSRSRIDSAAICNLFLKRLKECVKIGRDDTITIYENKRGEVENLVEKMTPELWQLMDQDESLDFIRIQKKVFLASHAAQ